MNENNIENKIYMLESYEGARIHFPEHFNANHKFQEYSGFISTDHIMFTREQHLITVNLHSSIRIPYALSNNEETQSKIVKPTIDIVIQELSTIDDLLLELRALANTGQIANEFYYKLNEGYPNGFVVYDYTKINTFSISNAKTPFEKVMYFKNIPKSILKPEYQELHEIAKNVKKNKKTNAYDQFYTNLVVKGKTLREATQRAIQIYKLSKRLNEDTALKDIFH